MEAVLDRALRAARECEVYGVTQTDTSMSFEANRLKMVDTRETSGLALRLVKDGRIGFSSTTNLAEEEALVERAHEMAPFGAEALMELPSVTRTIRHVDVYDSRLAELGHGGDEASGSEPDRRSEGGVAPSPVRGQSRQERDQDGAR